MYKKQASAPPLLVDIDHLDTLYDRTLRSLTDEDGVSIYTPIQLGLSVILTGGKYRDINKLQSETVPSERSPKYPYQTDVFSLIAIIHLTVLLEIPRQRLPVEKRYTQLTLETSDFAETIGPVRETLGTRALVVMVATLLHYNPTDKKVLYFCELAINRLGDGDEGFIRLPE